MTVPATFADSRVGRVHRLDVLCLDRRLDLPADADRRARGLRPFLCLGLLLGRGGRGLLLARGSLGRRLVARLLRGERELLGLVVGLEPLALLGLQFGVEGRLGLFGGLQRRGGVLAGAGRRGVGDGGLRGVDVRGRGCSAPAAATARPRTSMTIPRRGRIASLPQCWVPGGSSPGSPDAESMIPRAGVGERIDGGSRVRTDATRHHRSRPLAASPKPPAATRSAARRPGRGSRRASPGRRRR